MLTRKIRPSYIITEQNKKGGLAARSRSCDDRPGKQIHAAEAEHDDGNQVLAYSQDGTKWPC